MNRRMVIEVIDDEYAAVLRRIPGPERVRQIDDMYLFARGVIESRLREKHPDWSDEQLKHEISRSIADASD